MPNWINSLVVMDRFCPSPLKRREWEKRILQVQSGCGRWRVEMGEVCVCVCRWRIENINTEKNKDSLFLTVFSLFSFFSWISVGFSSILYQGPPNTMISFRGTILFKSKGYIFVSNTNLFIVCVENGENDFKANIFWLLFVLKPNVWLIKILSGKVYCFKLTVYIF